MLDGWLCLDKPAGISSNFAMTKVRRIVKEKTGYVGTLDPFATGVLPIAIGKARKFIQFIENNEKAYEFTVVYGEETNTLDNTGIIINKIDNIPTEKNIIQIIPKFLGKIKQTPPQFSAIKVNGQRAYNIARQNKTINLHSREVTIFNLELINFSSKEAKFFISCSKGTYIRALADDMAKSMGTLCYVKELKRISSGFFQLKNSITLEKLSKIVDTKELVNIILPIESPLDDIPALYLESNYCTKLRNGLAIALDSAVILSGNVRIFDKEQQKFKGICRISENGKITAVKMCID